jgi:hypothetical protein
MIVIKNTNVYGNMRMIWLKKKLIKQ